jgi:cation:H+ antiporter
MIANLTIFTIGLFLLYYGGHFLVDGSSALAKKWNVRPFVIGTVIIGFGTSAPEAFVSVIAQLKGSSDLSLGNILGSSIANIGLVLGLAALINPIRIQDKLARWEYPFLFAVTVLLTVLALGSQFNVWHGMAFLFLFVVFIVWSFVTGIDPVKVMPLEPQKQKSGLILFKLIGGLAALVWGAELLVRSGIYFANFFGMSELVIGTLLIAVGTSLPEMAATCIAQSKGETGLALGNIFGSNIFNLLLVSGLSLLIRPMPIDFASRGILLPTLLLVTLILFPIMKTSQLFGRRIGFAFVAGYFVFAIFFAFIA